MSEEDTAGSVPLIALQRHQYFPLGDSQNLDTDTDIDTSYPGPGYSPKRMSTPIASQARPRNQSRRSMIIVVASYVFDWAIILVMLGVAFYMGNRPPNRRHFFLEDPNIS